MKLMSPYPDPWKGLMAWYRGFWRGCGSKKGMSLKQAKAAARISERHYNQTLFRYRCLYCNRYHLTTRHPNDLYHR